MLLVLLFFFFFKQKTAYEMRISDWSSDVCSSDLGLLADNDGHRAAVLGIGGFGRTEFGGAFLAIADHVDAARVDAERRQVIFRGIGAALAERDIVVAGAAFVGVTFERDADRGVALQPLRLALRSEEHTSELQSLMRTSYAVFCLKKKKTK